MNGDVVTSVANPTTYVAAFFALVASVSLPEWVALTSIIVAILGLGITWYYKHKTLQLLERSKG